MLPIYWSIPFIVEFKQVNNFTLYLEFTQKAAVLENNTCTKAGALFLLGKDRTFLILTQDMSKIKAPTSVEGKLSVNFQIYHSLLTDIWILLRNKKCS